MQVTLCTSRLCTLPPSHVFFGDGEIFLKDFLSLEGRLERGRPYRTSWSGIVPFRTIGVCANSKTVDSNGTAVQTQLEKKYLSMCNVQRCLEFQNWLDSPKELNQAKSYPAVIASLARQTCAINHPILK